MESEASEVLQRLGVLGVGDVLSGLYIQEQGQNPWKRDHLTVLQDLHKDDLGAGSLVTPLSLRGEL